VDIGRQGRAQRSTCPTENADDRSRILRQRGIRLKVVLPPARALETQKVSGNQVRPGRRITCLEVAFPKRRPPKVGSTPSQNARRGNQPKSWYSSIRICLLGRQITCLNACRLRVDSNSSGSSLLNGMIKPMSALREVITNPTYRLWQIKAENVRVGEPSDDYIRGHALSTDSIVRH
jgi:hypothetical protein